LSVGLSAVTVREARAGNGTWGKVALGAAALAAGYYLGKRSNPPGTTYIYQQESSPVYSDNSSTVAFDSQLASYLAERDRQAAVEKDKDLSRAPHRIADRPNWTAAERKLLEANHARINAWHKQINDQVVAAERAMTPDSRWACFGICGRFGVGEAYGATLSV